MIGSLQSSLNKLVTGDPTEMVGYLTPLGRFGRIWVFISLDRIDWLLSTRRVVLSGEVDHSSVFKAMTLLHLAISSLPSTLLSF